MISIAKMLNVRSSASPILKMQVIDEHIYTYTNSSMKLCEPRNTGKQVKALKSFGLKFCAKKPCSSQVCWDEEFLRCYSQIRRKERDAPEASIFWKEAKLPAEFLPLCMPRTSVVVLGLPRTKDTQCMHNKRSHRWSPGEDITQLALVTAPRSWGSPPVLASSCLQNTETGRGEVRESCGVS